LLENQLIAQLVGRDSKKLNSCIRCRDSGNTGVAVYLKGCITDADGLAVAMRDVAGFVGFSAECFAGFFYIKFGKSFCHKQLAALYKLARRMSIVSSALVLTSARKCGIYKRPFMQERELPEGVGEPPQPAVSRERHRQRFEELAGAFNRNEFDRLNEDGSVTRIVSYERHIDPLDRKDLALVRDFRLRAAASGYREAFSPLVLPTQSNFAPGQSEAVESPERSHRALTFVQFGYEKPVVTKGVGTSGRRPDVTQNIV
jgi:hypothetical protein